MRRVVVTGIGLVSQLASGAQQTWNKIIKSESGIRKITNFDASDLASQIAGMVPRVESGEIAKEGEFNPDLYIEPKNQSKIDQPTAIPSV